MDFFQLGTSSIDTTCTIWGLETGQVIGRVNMVTGQVKTQLIAHDKEVYDIAFSKGKILLFNGFEKDLLRILLLSYNIYLVIILFLNFAEQLEVVGTCLLLLEQMDQFACLTYVIWSIQQLSMKTLNIPPY